MADYERIARVIRWLDVHRGEQPDLARLAGAAGLSPAHFHRLFRRWAGITPKDFLQCLTAEDAKRRLRGQASILAAALDAGLSGPGRLHDLLVTLESASPGEYKDGGRGLTVLWGWADETPFGPCRIGWTARGICHLSFHDRRAGGPGPLAREWPRARLVRRDAGARRWARRVFRPGPGPRAAIPAFVRGTSFQVRVWRALLAIPPGRLASYARVARAVGRPRAVRAAAGAVARNAVAYLIPCHRVIRGTGAFHRYRWGAARKRAMIAREAASGSYGAEGPSLRPFRPGAVVRGVRNRPGAGRKRP